MIQLKTGFLVGNLILHLQDVKVTTLKSEDFDKKRALFDKFVEEKGFSGWYETSGRLNIIFKTIDNMTWPIIGQFVITNDLLTVGYCELAR